MEPDGTLTTIAGVGAEGGTVADGDGGPATAAHVGRPQAIVAAPDGSIYFSDRWNAVIRRIAPDGTIERVAGVSGSNGNSGDGGPARNAQIDNVVDLAIAPDGGLLALDGSAQRLRRIAPDGTISTLAGSGPTGYGSGGFEGDGGPATAARLRNPTGVAVGADGVVYLADGWNNRVRRIDDRGVIATIAGGRRVGAGESTKFDSGTGGQVPFTGVAAIVVRSDGQLAVSDTYFGAVFRLGTAMPGFAAGTLIVPSEDGRELYNFDSTGRHLTTRSALTGAELKQFAYDAAGHLTTVTDADNNVTTIERDSSGKPTAIVGPYGQQTEMTLNAGGHLTELESPAGEVTTFTYGAGGLLTSMKDNVGVGSTFTYDANGRLIGDANAKSSSTTLTRTALGDGGRSVALSDPIGGTATSLVEWLESGTRKRVAEDSSGLQEVDLERSDGTTQSTDVDGMVVEARAGGDPQFGAQVPVSTETVVRTPSGHERMSTIEREVDATGTELHHMIQRETVWMKKHLGFSIDDVANCVAGFGDNVSYGLTGVARSVVGGNEVLDRSSKCYKGSDLVGELYPTKRAGEALKIGSKVCNFAAKKAGRGGRKGGRGGGEDRMRGSNRRWNQQMRDAAREGGLTGDDARRWRKQKEAEKRGEGMGGADNYDDYRDLVDDARRYAKTLKRNRSDNDTDQWGRRDDMP